MVINLAPNPPANECDDWIFDYSKVKAIDTRHRGNEVFQEREEEIYQDDAERIDEVHFVFPAA